MSSNMENVCLGYVEHVVPLALTFGDESIFLLDQTTKVLGKRQRHLNMA